MSGMDVDSTGADSGMRTMIGLDGCCSSANTWGPSPS